MEGKLGIYGCLCWVWYDISHSQLPPPNKSPCTYRCWRSLQRLRNDMDYPIGSDYIPLDNSASVHISDLVLQGQRTMRAELFPPASGAETKLELISPHQLLTHWEKLLAGFHRCLTGHQPKMVPGLSWFFCAGSSHHPCLYIAFRLFFLSFSISFSLFLSLSPSFSLSIYFNLFMF